MAGEIGNNLAQWLRDQAIRMRRTKWPDAHLLGDELFLIFSRAPQTTTGPITAKTSNPNFTPIQFESLDDLNIEPLDLAFLDVPDLQLEPATTSLPGTLDNGGTQLTNTRTTVRREVIPGVVLSGSGDSYSVEVYPKGLSSYLNDDIDDRDTDNIDTKVTVTAKHPQMAVTSVIPVGTWVWVWRVVTIEIIETVITGPEGQVLSKTTDITEKVVENLLMHPVWV